MCIRDRDQSNLTEKEVLDKLIDIDIGTSFFPSNGLFIELISTGTFELIDNQELKSVILDLFQKSENLASII